MSGKTESTLMDVAAPATTYEARAYAARDAAFLWPPPRSRGATPSPATCRSRSSSAASATPTSTRSATSGAAHAHRLPMSRATRSSAG